MKDLRDTKRFWRSRLPHWEVENASYFVTIRVAGSLPKAATDRLSEIQRSLANVPPDSEQKRQFRRELFMTMEKYLDSGGGYCPFENAEAAHAMLAETCEFADEMQWQVFTHCVMPNHAHFIAKPLSLSESADLETFAKQLQGRTARRINQILKRSGRFWQIDWFDRWIRDEAEYARTEAYIQNNPVKAGIVSSAADYPFTRQQR